MPRKPAVATESTRPKIERKAKQEASERMEGKLESLKALPLESASPKKTKPVLRKSKSKLRKKTAYKSMVKKAILENYNRKGTSVAAISKYIIANYDVPEDSFKRYLKASLAKQVESGLLVKKSVARYQLSAKAKPKKKPGEDQKTTKRKTSTKKSTKESTKDGDKKTTKKSTVKSKKDSTKETVKTNSARGSKKLAESKTSKKSTGSGRGKAKSAETTEGSSKLVWVWQYYDNGFYNYDPAASGVVEGVYQEYLTSPFTCDVRAVKSGQWEYEIDFRVMTQRNIKHSAHTTRKIRRLQIPESEKYDTNKRYEGHPDSTK